MVCSSPIFHAVCWRKWAGSENPPSRSCGRCSLPGMGLQENSGVMYFLLCLTIPIVYRWCYMVVLYKCHCCCCCAPLHTTTGTSHTIVSLRSYVSFSLRHEAECAWCRTSCRGLGRNVELAWDGLMPLRRPKFSNGREMEAGTA